MRSRTTASEGTLAERTLLKKWGPILRSGRMGPSSSDHLSCLPLAETLNSKLKGGSVLSGSFPSQCRRNRRADRGSPASAGVPAGLGRKLAVVPAGDVVESAVDRRDLRVDERSERTRPLANHLIDTSGEASPKRSNGARAADHRSLSIDVDVVSRDRVGISRNIRDAAPDEMAGIRRWRHVGSGLVSWLGEKVAYASARRAFLIRHFIPDDLAAIVAVGGGESRSAAGEGEGTRGREVDMLQAVGQAVG